MADLIYINGKRVYQELPLRSLLFGEGVFETFRYKSRLPVHFDKHINRLREGTLYLRMEMPEEAYLVSLVNNAVNKSGLNDLYVKLCLLSEGINPFYEASQGTQVLILIKNYPAPKESLRTSISRFRKSSTSPILKLKTYNYLENLLARREAMDMGYDEALFVNENNHLTEGSAGNIFWYKKKTLYTPAIDCGLLPGTVRAVLIESENELGFSIKEGEYTAQDLLESEFAFYTNSLAGVVPISQLEDKPFSPDSQTFVKIQQLIKSKLGWI